MSQYIIAIVIGIVLGPVLMALFLYVGYWVVMAIGEHELRKKGMTKDQAQQVTNTYIENL